MIDTKCARRSVVLAVSAGAWASCGEPGDPRTPATIEMADRLAYLVETVDPLLDEQMNFARLRDLTETGPPPDPQAAILYAGLVTREMMNAGLTAPALDQMMILQGLLAETGQADPVPGFSNSLDEMTGTAMLRMAYAAACRGADGLEPPAGELNLYPCFPNIPAEPGAAAIGSAARDLLTRAALWQTNLLDENPGNRRARWMLNLVAAGLGRWPTGIPEEHRLPMEGLGGDGELARFRDIAADAGVDAVSLSGGGVVEDFNGDGYFDILASSRGLLDQIRYFEGSATGRFTERTAGAGLHGLTGGLNLVHADYDNDGDADVFVLRGGWLVTGWPNSLLRNDGGVFADVTVEAGLLSLHPTQTGAWADYDGDGWLDLFIGNESADGETHQSELYRSNGDGTFAEVAEQAGLGVREYVKGVTWGDYDNDGRPDLYLSILHAPNRLFRNVGPTAKGGWSFEEVTGAAGVAWPEASFPTWFWDFDNDGWLDLFAAGYAAQTGDLVRELLGEPHLAELPRLYRNLGDGTFEDVTEQQGLDRIMYAMGSNFGDLDNDGLPDLIVGTGDPDLRQLMPNRAFRNTGEGFVEVTGAGGFGSLDKGHGISFVDYDNDGDTDVHMVLGGANEGDVAPNALYQNPGGGGSRIVLVLEGDRANRSGLGARITVTVQAADGSVRSFHRQASTGGSFGSNPLRQEIGLGDAAAVTEVKVVWPGSGTEDLVTGVQPGGAYLIREASGQAEPLELRPVG